MHGHMGDRKATARNLTVAAVDIKNKVLYVTGAVPGHQNSIVHISDAVLYRWLKPPHFPTFVPPEKEEFPTPESEYLVHYFNRPRDYIPSSPDFDKNVAIWLDPTYREKLIDSIIAERKSRTADNQVRTELKIRKTNTGEAKKK